MFAVCEKEESKVVPGPRLFVPPPGIATDIMSLLNLRMYGDRIDDYGHFFNYDFYSGITLFVDSPISPFSLWHEDAFVVNWHEYSTVKEYVKDGGNLKSCLLAKFSENLIYRKLLLNTGNGQLGFANPNDILGTGHDRHSFCPSHWGQNVLGETLMEVREILRKRVPTLEKVLSLRPHWLIYFSHLSLNLEALYGL